MEIEDYANSQLSAPRSDNIEEFEDLFHNEHGYPLVSSTYGYKDTKELLADVRELVVINNCVQFDWGHWPLELP